MKQLIIRYNLMTTIRVLQAVTRYSDRLSKVYVFSVKTDSFSNIDVCFGHIITFTIELITWKIKKNNM